MGYDGGMVYIANSKDVTKACTTTTVSTKEALDVNLVGGSGASVSVSNAPAIRFRGAYTMGYNGSNAVSTTVLRVGGASSWTGAATNAATDRIVTLTNCSTLTTIYAIVVASGSGAPAGVSATDFEQAIQPLQYVDMIVPGGYDVVVIASAVSTDKVHARELLMAAAT